MQHLVGIKLFEPNQVPAKIERVALEPAHFRRKVDALLQNPHDKDYTDVNGDGTDCQSFVLHGLPVRS